MVANLKGHAIKAFDPAHKCALTPAGLQVYVVGDVGIQEELDLKGIDHIGGPADKDQVVELRPGYAMPHDHDVSFPLVSSSASEIFFERRLLLDRCSANSHMHFRAKVWKCCLPVSVLSRYKSQEKAGYSSQCFVSHQGIKDSHSCIGNVGFHAGYCCLDLVGCHAL